ncbi:unnamed protein product [Pylaiella littoralis]
MYCAAVVQQCKSFRARFFRFVLAVAFGSSRSIRRVHSFFALCGAKDSSPADMLYGWNETVQLSFLRSVSVSVLCWRSVTVVFPFLCFWCAGQGTTDVLRRCSASGV